jgi:hypothetical protein
VTDCHAQFIVFYLAAISKIMSHWSRQVELSMDIINIHTNSLIYETVMLSVDD